MTVHGFLSVPSCRHWRHCRAFPPFLGHSPFHRWCGLHSSESMEIEKRSVFLFLLPRSRLAGPCFRRVGWFSSWWECGLPLVEAFGESLGRGCAFFDRLVLPDSRASGAGLPGPPGSWSLELLPLSHSGCVQLLLPLLFITPFTGLVFPRKNFGFVDVDGVFGS